MDFRRVLPEATIYVYDNNSTDGTADLARTAGAVVRHEYQQGKGNARSTILATTWCGFLPTTSSAARSRIS